MAWRRNCEGLLESAPRECIFADIIGHGTTLTPHDLIFGRNRAELNRPMKRETKTRLVTAALIYSMTNAVIFGAGIITVLNVPALRSDAFTWIPVVVASSLVLAAPVAWLIAPRLRARY
jgi:hypothetical protein